MVGHAFITCRVARRGDADLEREQPTRLHELRAVRVAQVHVAGGGEQVGVERE